jgi:triosephosphate isomerase
MDNPREWIEWVMDESVKYGLGKLQDIHVTYLLPEALLISAIEKLAEYAEDETKNIHIGCQGVFRQNIAPGGNFGAFTTNLPAAAAKSIGCTWSIIGHSEERRDKLQIIGAFEPACNDSNVLGEKAANAVHGLINEEVLCALDSGMDVLLCIGETADEKGEGSFEEQKPRIKAVLKSQLEIGLKGVQEKLNERQIVIGYEPIWAIGPGKTPPDGEYIAFVSEYIKSVVKELYDFDPVVVYGGGLKEENAGMISKIESIGGGLVALTKFTQPIAFEPEGLRNIIQKYVD